MICKFRVPSYITNRQWQTVRLSKFPQLLRWARDQTHFRLCQPPLVKRSHRNGKRPHLQLYLQRVPKKNSISKALVDSTNGKWAQELTTAVWGHNVSQSRATGFTPFRLLYGDEAVTPEELRLGSFRTQVTGTPPLQCHVQLKTSKNNRLVAACNLEKYHAERKAWRDKKVLRKDIKPGDMVLIRHPNKQGKLQS